MDKSRMYDLLVNAIQTQAAVVNMLPHCAEYANALGRADEAMVRLVLELEKLES